MELFLLIISAIGSVIAAITGLLLYWARKGSPDIIATTQELPPQTQDTDLVTRTVRFDQPTEPARWLVYEICIAGACHRWLARPGYTEYSESGVSLGYQRVGDWTDRIQYEPPVSQEVVLLHPAAPKHPKLLFRVRLRSDFRTKRRVKVLSTPRPPD